MPDPSIVDLAVRAVLRMPTFNGWSLLSIFIILGMALGWIADIWWIIKFAGCLPHGMDSVEGAGKPKLVIFSPF